MGRFLFTLPPLLTFVGVGVLVLWVGAARPIESIRVWGGSTDALPRFSGFIEAEVDGQPLVGAELRLTAQPEQGSPVSAALRLDDSGRAEVSLLFQRPPGSIGLRAALPSGSRPTGRIALSSRHWLASATRRGGYSRLPEASGLSLQFAPARGAFAVPFPGEVWVQLLRQGAALPGARLELEADGAQVQDEVQRTDSRGVARFTLTPHEHVVTARATATTLEGTRAELAFSIPVVPGAISIEQRGGTLRIHSPIERPEAFITVISEQGRLLGARVPLVPFGDGTAEGFLDLPRLPNGRYWAAAKSDPATPSPASVGWPLFTDDEPARTFDVADRLLLDTGPSALAAERERRRAVRRTALAVALFGAALSAIVLAVATRRGRHAARAHLLAELGAESSAGLLPDQSLRSLLSIVLIALGFLALAAIVGWRLT